jgi:hypothetical protein
LAGQFLAVFPTLIYFALKTWRDTKWRLFHWLSWGPIAFFAIMALRGSVEPNWPAVSHLSIAILAMAGATQLRGIKIAALFWGILVSLAVGLVVTKTAPKDLGKLAEPYQFEELAKVVPKYEPLYASTYQMASQLWFLTQKPVYKLSKMSRYDFFDELPQSIPTESKFFLARFDYEIELPAWIDQSYSIVKIATVDSNLEILEIQKR